MLNSLDNTADFIREIKCDRVNIEVDQIYKKITYLLIW